MTEYLLFCTDGKAPDIKEVQEALGKVGWTFRAARDWMGGEGFDPIGEGAVEKDDVLLGWPVKDEMEKDFEKAVAAGDRKQLDQWVAATKLGAVLWSSCVPFDFNAHAPVESLKDAKKLRGKAYADHLEKTKAMYIVTNCAKPEFNALVLGAIALLKDGVIEDPARGPLIQAPADTKELKGFRKNFPKEE